MFQERPWIGLDVGERRIGIALSDALGVTAQPHSVLQRRDLKSDLSALVQLAAERNACGFVVGLPRRTGGEEGPEVAKIKEFGRRLQEQSRLPVEWYDERFSTVIAERALQEQGIKGRARRQRVDQVAAAIILQDFLDRRRNNG